MAEARDFNRILDDCLDRLLLRGETVESCLARYPQQAVELEPLLRAMLQTQEALARLPQPARKAEARLRLGQALGQSQRSAAPSRWSRGLWHSPRWAAAAAAVLVVALLAGAGAGTVAASTNSRPDEPLYGVKRKAETVRLFFILDDDDKAGFYVGLVDRRLVEMAGMAESGRPREVELLGRDMQEHLERLRALSGVTGLGMPVPRPQVSPADAGGPAATPATRETPTAVPAAGLPGPDGALARRAEALAALLERNVERRRHRLEEALANAPPELQPRIRRAVALSEERHGQVLEEIKRQAREGGREQRERRPGGLDMTAPRPPGRGPGGR